MRNQFITHVLLSFIFTLLMAACSLPSRAAPPAADVVGPAPLRPGDTLGGMTLKSSGGDGQTVSIWDLCRRQQGSAEPCRVPAVTELAIGPADFSVPEAVGGVDWDQMAWTLSLDGQPVDLEAFGTQDVLRPRKAPHGRDAYHVYRAWDVVLAQPTPGEHTMRATVQLATADAETIEWAISFTVP